MVFDMYLWPCHVFVSHLVFFTLLMFRIYEQVTCLFRGKKFYNDILLRRIQTSVYNDPEISLLTLFYHRFVKLPKTLLLNKLMQHAFYGTRRFITMLTRALKPIPTPYCFRKIYFNIILARIALSRPFNKDCIRYSHLPHARYVSANPTPFCFDNPDNI